MASNSARLEWVAACFVMIVLMNSAVPVAAEGLTAEGSSPSTAGVARTADAVLAEMSQVAGVIFAGEVRAVRRPGGSAGSGGGAAEGVVEVDFRVDQGVRGPAAGSLFTLREWAGLWDATGGAERYRAGQRMLVFFYEADAHGLSSPVHGRDGAVPLRGGGPSPGPDDTGGAAAAEWMVDLRWVQALALRRATPILAIERRVVSASGTPPEKRIEDTEPGGDQTLLRREPIQAGVPKVAAAAIDAEPLSEVVAVCQQAMRRGHVSE